MSACNKCGKIQKLKVSIGGVSIAIGDVSRLKDITDSFKRRNSTFAKEANNLVSKNLNEVKSIKPNKNIPKSIKTEQYKKIQENEFRFVGFINQYIKDTRVLFQEMKDAVAEL